MIFLGPNKTKTSFMIFFDTKDRLTDISGAILTFLHYFRIFHVHVQVSKSKMNELILFWVAMKLK